MASIRNLKDGREVAVSSRSLVGRSARADIRLAAATASMEHATIGWTGVEWLLRDLKSRNGTRVNGMYIQARTCRLKLGDTLTFGDPDEAWLWLDDSPPIARATQADGVVVTAVNGVLLLPDESLPAASVFSRDGGWYLDIGGAISAVADGDSISVDGHRFCLSLPLLAADDAHTRTLSASVHSATWTFRPSQDGEHVDIEVDIGQARLRLRPRSLNQLLLQLADERLRDATARHDTAECGWVYSDLLSRQLGVSPEKLNVDVFRARRAVAELRYGNAPAFADAHDIIERRCTTQLRIGAAQLVIERQGAAAVVNE
jgi:hypothetical protein